MTKKHDIIWFESVDSTNEEAKRRISDIDNLSVLSAYEQTNGRGQRGNKWSSAAGENLMFSIVLKFSHDESTENECLPLLPAHDQFVLNEIASLSVMDFLSMHGISAKVKWPNDIYVNDKKICGILIENSLCGNLLSSSIIGIGLNINQRNFDVNIPNPTSMVLYKQGSNTHSGVCEENTDNTFDIHICLKEFMEIFSSYFTKLLSSKAEFPTLRQQYNSHLWRLGSLARFIDYTTMPSGHLNGPINILNENTDNIPEFLGIIRGLSEIGNLLVEDLSSGTLREFGFKEIGYIL